MKVKLLGEEEREGGKGGRCAPGRETSRGPLPYGLLRVGILGEVSGEDLNKISIRFPGMSFQDLNVFFI